MTKSIVTCSNFHFRMGRSCRRPLGLWCSALIVGQVRHWETNSIVSFFIPGHQKWQLKSRYIFVLIGWIDNLNAWASFRTSNLSSRSLSTHIRSWNLYNPSLIILKSRGSSNANLFLCFKISGYADLTSKILMKRMGDAKRLGEDWIYF